MEDLTCLLATVRTLKVTCKHADFEYRYIRAHQAHAEKYPTYIAILSPLEPITLDVTISCVSQWFIQLKELKFQSKGFYARY